jgi:glutamyl/glutaminyl-tRNA synthetase
MDELKEKLKPYLAKYPLDELTDEQFTKMVEITREPLTLLSDITDAVPYFFGKDVTIEPDAWDKALASDECQNVLKDFIEKAQGWDWTEENLHEKLADFRAYWKETTGMKPKVTMWAIRAAITGRTCGADMVGILDILGKETSLYRAQKAVKQTVA